MYKGLRGAFAQNLTDVDDKIVNRASERSHRRRRGGEFSNAFIEQIPLGCLDPDIRPRATHCEGQAMGDD